MSNIFDDLKKFAVSDILSVSGKDKTTKVIEEHMNVLVEVALIKGEQSKQAEVDELQERVKELELINFDSELHFDAAKEHIDHLQKKIDRALDHAVNHGGYDDLTHIINILKGDQL